MALAPFPHRRRRQQGCVRRLVTTDCCRLLYLDYSIDIAIVEDVILLGILVGILVNYSHEVVLVCPVASTSEDDRVTQFLAIATADNGSFERTLDIVIHVYSIEIVQPGVSLH